MLRSPGMPPPYFKTSIPRGIGNGSRNHEDEGAVFWLSDRAAGLLGVGGGGSHLGWLAAGVGRAISGLGRNALFVCSEPRGGARGRGIEGGWRGGLDAAICRGLNLHGTKYIDALHLLRKIQASLGEGHLFKTGHFPDTPPPIFEKAFRARNLP